MFTDGRSKRVLFLAHCALNQNAISDGTADYPGAHGDLLRMLLEEGVGLVQLPCPELRCLGLDRGDPRGGARPVVVENTRIRGEMSRPAAQEKLDGLVEEVLCQAREYQKHGFRLVGVVGMNRSPCCGVESTSREDRELPGQGVFMEKLLAAFRAEGMEVPAVGIKAGPEGLEKVRGLIEGRS